MDFIHDIYNLFWGDLFTIPLPGGKTIGISLLVLILIPSGIFFSVKTKFLPIRMFKEMVKIAVEKKEEAAAEAARNAWKDRRKNNKE